MSNHLKIGKELYHFIDGSVRRLIKNVDQSTQSPDNLYNKNYFTMHIEGSEDRIEVDSFLDENYNFCIDLNLYVCIDEDNNYQESRNFIIRKGFSEMIPYRHFINTGSENTDEIMIVVKYLMMSLSRHLNYSFVFHSGGIPMFLFRDGKMSNIYTL